MEIGPRPHGPIDAGPLQESAAMFGMLAATARLQISGCSATANEMWARSLQMSAKAWPR